MICRLSCKIAFYVVISLCVCFCGHVIMGVCVSTSLQKKRTTSSVSMNSSPTYFYEGSLIEPGAHQFVCTDGKLILSSPISQHEDYMQLPYPECFYLGYEDLGSCLQDCSACSVLTEASLHL